MADPIKFFKVTALPAIPLANSLYFVMDPDVDTETVYLYVTDNTGNVKTLATLGGGGGGGGETTTTMGALFNSAGNAVPNNSDIIGTAVSGGLLKKITWTNAKAFLKTYFDTLYSTAADLAAVLAAAVQRSNHTGTQSADTITDGATNKAYTALEKTKLGYISVTQGVDLDDIESRVNNLDAAVVLKGDWDASAGTFPGGGTAQAGASYIVSVAGTVGGVQFNVGDRVIAVTDNASTTVFAGNWFKADYTDQVLSVNGATGAVTITTITGNAGTATALQNARTIGGVSFNGTADITVSTATAGFTISGGNLALGANSITMSGSIGATGTRVTKLWATDGEFTNMPTVGGTSLSGVAAVLTNKTLLASSNVVEEITTTASSATPTPTGGSLRNFFTVTALAAPATFAAPSGAPANGNYLTIRIKDDGTARALAFNAIYRAIGVTLPTTTVVSKTLYIGCRYNSQDSKWDVLAVGQEA